jgi:two-component system, sensor histidine kinase and response regulator
VTVEVKDTGYGIAQEDLATLFERFRQGKNKRAGSGLGLHLSQRILESHGGKINVVSELGKGSIFTVYLPKK